MMLSNRHKRNRGNRRLISLVGFSAMMAAPMVHASDNFLAAWSVLYDPTLTDNNAGCQVCHANDLRSLNPYGRAIALCSGNIGTIATRIRAVEGQDSDSQGDSNLAEINADTQPGWTSPSVPIFSRSTCAPAGTDTYAGAGDVDPNGVNPPPIADANGPYFGLVDQQVQFDGSGSSDDGSITAYDWTFGDGGTGTGVSPVHTYTVADEYTVTLIVTDNLGAQSAPSVTTATIGDVQDPVADPNGPYTGTEGVALTFDGSGSFDPDGGSITQYLWNFGDGNTGTGVAPSHTYVAAGIYNVTLNVIDDEGAMSPVPGETTATIADDTDGDGVPDNQDNCINDANADQRDTNNDGFGNICDPDLNNDGFVNFLDLGIMKSVFFSTDPADEDADLDGDGLVNFTDLGIMKDMFFGTPGPSGLVP